MSLEQTPRSSILPRIVTVDDDPRIINIMKLQLGMTFPDVILFQNPLDVLDYLQSNERDVLITDGMMPQMRGEVLAGIVRQQYPGMGRILVSGTADEHIADKTLFDEVLNKPYRATMLLGAVASAYAKGRLRRNP